MLSKEKITFEPILHIMHDKRPGALAMLLLIAIATVGAIGIGIGMATQSANAELGVTYKPVLTCHIGAEPGDFYSWGD